MPENFCFIIWKWDSIRLKPAILLLLMLSVFTHNTFAQIAFEKGYFIDNNNQKTECLIKNYDWKNSPSKIDYKLSEDSEQSTLSIDEISAFGVSNLKYKRFTVAIDQSNQTISNLSKDRQPVLKEETLFLKTLIEGKASLYLMGKQNLYFYTVDTSVIKQLIHKEYITEVNTVGVNNAFKSQLWIALKCECITLNDIEKTEYNKGDLIAIFEKYNTCVGSDFQNFTKNPKRIYFNLGIKPGLRLGNLSIKNFINSSQVIDFGSSPGFSIGLDFELILPWNKNKWAFTFEPTYQYFNAKDPRPNFSNTVDYKSIELPMGIKYYMFLSSRSKLFLLAQIVIADIPIQSSIGTLEITTNYNLNFGLGYVWNNRVSIETRYGTPRHVLTKYALYSSSYQSFSIIFGYYIF